MAYGIAGICAVQVALCAIRGLTECPACRSGLPLAWIGAGFYAVMGAAALLRRDPPVRFMAQWAFAIHLWLVVAMIRRDSICPLCIAAAAGAVALMALSIAGDARPFWRWILEFACILVVAAAASAHLEPAARPPQVLASATQCVIYRNAHCPYCLQLENQVLPEVRRRAGEFQVVFLDASEYEFVRVTPTVLVRGPKGQKVFEGLPAADDLVKTLSSVR